MLKMHFNLSTRREEMIMRITVGEKQRRSQKGRSSKGTPPFPFFCFVFLFCCIAFEIPIAIIHVCISLHRAIFPEISSSMSYIVGWHQADPSPGVAKDSFMSPDRAHEFIGGEREKLPAWIVPYHTKQARKAAYKCGVFLDSRH